MKHTQFILLAIAAFAITACQEPNAPTPGGTGGGGYTPPEPITAYADFSYSIQQPLTVIIDGKSKGRSVSYDFGDGSDPEKHGVTDKVTHKYAKEGTYKIRADVSGDKSTTDSYTMSVTLSAPKVYIDGIRYLSIDEDGEYYRAKMTDDDFWTTPDVIINTGYTPILNNSRLPYEYTFKTPVLMNHLSEDEFYTLYIYHSTKGGSDIGTQCLKQDISRIVIKLYLKTIEVSNNSGTRVQLLMHYE